MKEAPVLHIGRPDTAPIARGHLLAACRRGDLPAEAFPDPADRERLVRELWRAGWSDVEIATHTHMTTYTTGRIQARLGLAAHPSKTGAVA
ncbi:hypothetical protein [Amycolatopsis samaneae]|uniref:Uncharacterized protein n=1 Tax=Amycolatopsis samaneae TaxID=664691 RepID=A0ABW5GXD7_9PSEU